METFEGRGAVITGGASGIGFACAQEFTRRGARVVLADIDQSALDAAVERLRGDGAEAHGVICDVTRLDAVEHLADEAFRLLGEVNLVFNNAGIAYGSPIADVTHGDWRWVIDVDLWGPIHGVEAFLPRLIEQGGDRHIMFTSSFAGMVGNAGLGPYCVAKFGVVALAEGLARELKGEGIGVSVLCPMIVDTPLMANSERSRSNDYGTRTSHTDEVVQGLTSVMTPTDADVAADDVARLTADAVVANRLYILPHRASRESIRRRFERIDRTFDEQAAEGWTH
ncbi:SDR family NAD(P)-dependent oxidoreductase [Mycobacterium sp. ITM-2016-00318]|uniref:SDR family NAD(P)-dependent oxidoreductase n=1 Tax=Mycobacterium sp. ITM-2016-00318 TaxID=2099693 RepID=UPI000CF97AA6|nr:SDR family NAD(P)-dependent oxidoreductase [Mycobacterium sp. ITM-2016-00318]WNG91479.1 SDR family NAD(P)-dependent oxidoreductase [Mycobacterium sp. ITM-2016-00318]